MKKKVKNKKKSRLDRLEERVRKLEARRKADERITKEHFQQFAKEGREYW